jgi:hypothetical protein
LEVRVVEGTVVAIENRTEKGDHAVKAVLNFACVQNPVCRSLGCKASADGGRKKPDIFHPLDDFVIAPCAPAPRPSGTDSPAAPAR